MWFKPTEIYGMMKYYNEFFFQNWKCYTTFCTSIIIVWDIPNGFKQKVASPFQHTNNAGFGHICFGKVEFLAYRYCSNKSKFLIFIQDSKSEKNSQISWKYMIIF